MQKGKIYLLPTPIGDREISDVIPDYNNQLMRTLDYFIVENIRTARRFLSNSKVGRPIDEFKFAELNEHTTPQEISELLTPVLNGVNAGVMSEAGVPGVADPGADVVALAHLHGIEVVPLVGPSSIILALMASGLNGQSFAFNGYLPIKQPERNKAIKQFERRALTEGQSQIFIEAPYRNVKLFEDFIISCLPTTHLTIAADILQGDQFIRTTTISKWKGHVPDIHKRPTIFIIG